jgi:hypothetical protein
MLLAGGCSSESVVVSLAAHQAACLRAVVATMDSSFHRLSAADITLLQQNGICTYDMPEYNDEQRLGNGDRGYGPIVHAYAGAWGRQLLSHVDFDKGWLFMAIVNVESGNIPSTYGRLGLGTGYNCMYIQHTHWPSPSLSLKSSWDIAMGPIDATGFCSGGIAKVLARRSEQPLDPADSYPVAARFMEAPNLEPTLGVRCGNVWCIAGAKGGGDVLPPAFSGLSGIGSSSRWAVKGWFDDQTLAINSGSGLAPFMRLAVVPNDNLGTYDVAHFVSGGWTEVATIIVPKGASLGKYGTSGHGFGLAEGKNTLFIHADDKGGGVYVWSGRIVNASFPAGHVYGKEVHWEDHRSVGIPIDGTARWHWSETDEELWVRCDVGCCLVYGDS